MLEKEDVHTQYSPWNIAPRFLSNREFHEEMRRPPGRFRSPFSVTERIRFALSAYASRFLVTQNIPLFNESGTPLSWQAILNYLYREGVLESANFSTPRLRSDKPTKAVVSLRAHYDADNTDAHDRPFSGYGTSDNFDEALSKALGELLERYFGTVYKTDELTLASTRQMREARMDFLAPEQCCQYESWQRNRFSIFQFSDDTKFRWLTSTELTNNKKTCVPAQLMYWMYDWRKENEPLLIPMTSNGSAGHFSYEEAAIAAIHEYVQRDGFLMYWMNTLSPRVIDLSDADDPELTEIAEKLTRFNMRAYFLNITSDLGIPTSACVLVHDEDGEPFLSVGAATGQTAKESLMSSYNESLAVQHGASGRRAEVDFTLEDYEPFVREDIGMEERTKLWHGNEMYEKARFLISGSQQSFTEFAATFPHFKSVRKEYETLIELFRSKGSGYEIYAHESRHRVLSRLGYHVVRVFIPALMPMHLQEQYAALGNVRLTQVPLTLGYEHPVRNIYPHLFP